MKHSMKRTTQWRYEPNYTRCETGVYQLVGTIPGYLSMLLFETEELAKAALKEAKEVQAGNVDHNSKFAQAWYTYRKTKQRLVRN